MTAIYSKTVDVPVPALMIAIFGLGLVIGMILGVAAYERGVAKSEEKWRLEEATKPTLDPSLFCVPSPPVQK